MSHTNKVNMLDILLRELFSAAGGGENVLREPEDAPTTV